MAKFQISSIRLSSRERGFTLVELLLAIGISVIISTTAVAAFVNYTQSQVLETVALDIKTTLETAKSHSQSQSKPAPCADAVTLEGYRVTARTVLTSVTEYFYDLYVVCGSDKLLLTKKLPPELSYGAGTTNDVFFEILTGEVVGTGAIILQGYGKTRTLNVNSVGRIIMTNP